MLAFAVFRGADNDPHWTELDWTDRYAPKPGHPTLSWAFDIYHERIRTAPGENRPSFKSGYHLEEYALAKARLWIATGDAGNEPSESRL